MPIVLPFDSAHQRETFSQTALVISGGGMIALPTESSYGLGVSPFEEAAITRLFRAKERPNDKPLLVLIGDVGQLSGLVAGIPRSAELLMRAFWPGPVTIIFPAHADLPSSLTADSGSLGIRLPRVHLLRDLLVEVGPVTGTSANRSGEAPIETVEQLLAVLGSHIDLILDGGPMSGGLPSTVIDSRFSPRLVREGAVSRVAVSNVLQGANLELSS